MGIISIYGNVERMWIIRTLYSFTRFTYVLLTFTPCALTFVCFSFSIIYLCKHNFFLNFLSNLHTSWLFTAEYCVFLKNKDIFVQKYSTVLDARKVYHNTFTTFRCHISILSVDPVISFVAFFPSSTWFILDHYGIIMSL